MDVDALGFELVEDHAAVGLEAEDKAGSRQLFIYIDVAIEGIELGRLGLPVADCSLLPEAAVGQKRSLRMSTRLGPIHALLTGPNVGWFSSRFELKYWIARFVNGALSGHTKAARRQHGSDEIYS